MTDEERKAKHAAYMREYNRKRRETDPAFVEYQREKSRKAQAKRRADPEKREQMLAATQEWRDRTKSDEAVQERRRERGRRAYRAETPEQRARRSELGRARREAEKAADPDGYRERQWAKHLQRTFGITVADYNAMLERQGGACVCGATDNGFERGGKRRRLAVDHCHTTGRIRGVLCDHCNQSIGALRDDPDLMRRLADYLDR